MKPGESSFHFSCRRSGRCCRVPDGFAFVDEAELPAMAKSAGMELVEFTKAYLRSVVDPSTAEARLCLRDRPDGACALLDGDNECGVYEARPKGCRDFPEWPSVLENAAGLERAMELCPGIEQRPAGAARGAALLELGRVLVDAESLGGGSAGKPGKGEAEDLEWDQGCGFAAADMGPGEYGGPWVTGLEFELILDGIGALVASGQSLAPAGCPMERVGLEAGTSKCGGAMYAPLACRGAHAPDSNATAACAAARDTLEASLPWPRTLAPLGDMLRRRQSPDFITLNPTLPSGRDT